MFPLQWRRRASGRQGAELSQPSAPACEDVAAGSRSPLGCRFNDLAQLHHRDLVAHKLNDRKVVEARLKGSGMHWARSHVNALVALWSACSDRWTQLWPQIEGHLRQQFRHKRLQRQRARRAALAATWTPPAVNAALPATPPPTGRRHSPTIVEWPPTTFHPWKGPGYLAARRRAANGWPKS